MNLKKLRNCLVMYIESGLFEMLEGATSAGLASEIMNSETCADLAKYLSSVLDDSGKVIIEAITAYRFLKDR